MRAATLLVLAATVTGLAVPEILWKGLRYRGVAECNTVLHRVQSGVMPMTTDDRQKLKNYAAAGDETLAKLSDEEVLSAFEIRDREELEEICARHGRQMNLAWDDVSLETKCVNADGTVLEYPKVGLRAVNQKWGPTRRPRRCRDPSTEYLRGGRGGAATRPRNIHFAAAAAPRLVRRISTRRPRPRRDPSADHPRLHRSSGSKGRPTSRRTSWLACTSFAENRTTRAARNSSRS